MLKNLIFFLLFCFVLFVCLFVFCLGGGGAHASQGKQRED